MTQSCIINPYAAAGMSLIFFGAPHELEDNIPCHKCRDIRYYKNGDVMIFCDRMKFFCNSQQTCQNIILQSSMTSNTTPKCIIPIPTGVKSWNFIVRMENDDTPDIIPIFHKDPTLADSLEKVVVSIEKKMNDKEDLEYELAKIKHVIDELTVIKNHILYGTPLGSRK